MRVIWMMRWLACVDHEHAKHWAKGSNFDIVVRPQHQPGDTTQFGPELIRIHHLATSVSHDFTHRVRNAKGKQQTCVGSSSSTSGRPYSAFAKRTWSWCNKSVRKLQSQSLAHVQNVFWKAWHAWSTASGGARTFLTLHNCTNESSKHDSEIPCLAYMSTMYIWMICSEYDYVDIYTHYTCISNYTVHIITIYCKAHWNKQNGAEAPPNWQM